MKLGAIDLFQGFFWKITFYLGSRGISFALLKCGCSFSAGLALTVGFALQALLTGEGFTNMMAPSGASGASSSGNWREYLNLSSDNKGDSAPEQATPSAAWSGSWIEKWLNQEVAPNEGGHEATSRVMEQAGPSQPAPNIQPVEPGEERNSQPSQGVGQRLPGSLEISSPGISGESLFRDLEQPRREPAPQPMASSSAPAQAEVDQLKCNIKKKKKTTFPQRYVGL
jgi:hypothetical protein